MQRIELYPVGTQRNPRHTFPNWVNTGSFNSFLRFIRFCCGSKVCSICWTWDVEGFLVEWTKSSMYYCNILRGCCDCKQVGHILEVTLAFGAGVHLVSADGLTQLRNQLTNLKISGLSRNSSVSILLCKYNSSTRVTRLKTVLYILIFYVVIVAEKCKYFESFFYILWVYF